MPDMQYGSILCCQFVAAVRVPVYWQTLSFELIDGTQDGYSSLLYAVANDDRATVQELLGKEKTKAKTKNSHDTLHLENKHVYRLHVLQSKMPM